MQGGTLADDFPGRPKALYVFEGLLAVCSAERAEARAIRWGRWQRAMDLWVFNMHVLQFLRQFNTRFEKNFDVVTWHPGAFAELLCDRLDDLGVHPQKVFADNYRLLQLDVAMSPDYDVVFDPDPAHAHGYGFKCRQVDYQNLSIW